MSGPDVAVVVATHNRSRLLPRLVTALEGQQGAPPFELVIVDDHSLDDTPQVLAELAAASTLPIRILRQDANLGPAPARNRAWRSTEASVVAFTDDDCVPHPKWLGQLVAASATADIAQGTTLPNPEMAPEGLLPFCPHVTYERGHYETCNIAYRRSVLEQVGGFDETFQNQSPLTDQGYRSPIWGEDTDLAWRAKEQGATTVFNEDAIVWHDLKRGRVRDRLRDLPRRRGMAVVIKRHPQMRDTLTWRCFTEPSHPWALVAMIGVLALLRRPTRLSRWVLAFFLFLPWTKHRATPESFPVWPLTLPSWFLLDVAEVAVMTRAGLRQRTPLF